MVVTHRGLRGEMANRSLATLSRPCQREQATSNMGAAISANVTVPLLLIA